MNNNLCSKIKVRIISTYKRLFRTKLLLYYIEGTNYVWKELYPIRVATSIHQLADIHCDISFRQLAQNRLNSGNYLIYCCDKAKLIGYGWIAKNVSIFYAWEIANVIHFSLPVDVLYDFFVIPNYRKRGIYKSLLHFIINNCSDKTLLTIYVDSKNSPSNKAIISCGFKFMCKLTHFSNRNKQMIKHDNIKSIRRASIQ